MRGASPASPIAPAENSPEGKLLGEILKFAFLFADRIGFYFAHIRL
jgi:hypothetical protein